MKIGHGLYSLAPRKSPFCYRPRAPNGPRHFDEASAVSASEGSLHVSSRPTMNADHAFVRPPRRRRPRAVCGPSRSAMNVVLPEVDVLDRDLV